jgi:CRP-like cAMP-binding protein
MSLPATSLSLETRPEPPHAPRPSVRERARAASPRELAAIPWLAGLTATERQQATSGLLVVEVMPGEPVCRSGRAASYWFGVIEGLLRHSEPGDAGRPTGFGGVAPGGWCCEDTVLQRAPYRWDLRALRRSVVAALPLEDFHALLEGSLGFNQYLLLQLHERLGQVATLREMERRSDPDLRVARHLAALSHPRLHPGVGDLLRITQQELGYLVGLSRQRVNEALGRLEAERLIKVAYGGVQVLEAARLQQFGNAAAEARLTPRTASAPAAAAGTP